MSVVCIIPARGGSRRIPRKNIRDFHGKPIIAYSIELALKSRLFSRVIVSTDDEDIAKTAIFYGATVHRREFDDGSKGTQEVARDVLMVNNEVDIACVLYATSPLLNLELLSYGLECLLNSNCNYAMSVSADPLADAGCFYWGAAEAFVQKLPLIFPGTLMIPLPAGRVCDINTEQDWRLAESMFEALRRANEHH